MNVEGKRILVTGGAGFIGSHLVRAALGEGASVTVMDRDRGTRLDGLHAEFVQADMAEPLGDTLKRIEPDIIFHLAGFTLPGRDPKFVAASLRANVVATVNVLESLRGTTFESFIFTSCSEIYGAKNATPFREDMLPEGTSPYSASKLAGETYCNLYHGTYGYPTTVLRPFNVYGPMQSPTLLVPQAFVSCLKKQDFVMTKGEQTREFNYVDDTVRAFLLAAGEKRARGETLNIGCGEDHPVREVVDMIISLFGNGISARHTLPYRENEVWRMRSDSTKAEHMLGWKPTTALNEGLALTAAWYRGAWKQNPRAPYFVI